MQNLTTPYMVMFCYSYQQKSIYKLVTINQLKNQDHK